MISQLGNLIISTAGVFGLKIQIRHALGKIRQLLDRLGDLFGKPDRQDNTKDHTCNRKIGKKFIGDLHAVPDTVQSQTHDEVVAVVQAAPDLQIFLLVEGIPDLLHGIIIRLDQYIFIVGVHPVMVGKKPACQQGFILIGAHAPELGIHLLVADDQADVILSVPCCQHEVNKQIKNEMLEPVLRYGILKERMSALITDAVRADLLESKGYDTQILEFIDMEHTPKNLLIRAVRTGKRSDQGKVEKMLAALNIHPTLDRLLNEKEQEGSVR